MRIPRGTVIERVRSGSSSPVLLVEAPAGAGKSWLLRQLAGTTIRHRGRLPAEASEPVVLAEQPLVVDGVDVLAPDELERLTEIVERADRPGSVMLTARLFDADLLEAATFAGVDVIDMDGLRVTADDVVEAISTTTGSRTIDPAAAAQLVDRADGFVRDIAATLQSAGADSGRWLPVVSDIVDTNARTVMRQLSSDDLGVLAILARSRGLSMAQVDQLGGDTARRLTAAGAPVYRNNPGPLRLATPWAFAAAPLAVDQVQVLVHDLADPLLRVELLLDAGKVDEAADLFGDLGETVAASGASAVATMLSRFGARVDRSPPLLLVRADANRSRGRIDDAHRDIDTAMDLTAELTDDALRRRIEIEQARRRLESGDVDGAVGMTEALLARLGPGEGRTFARANELLASAAATSDSRSSLQQAAEFLTTAVRAWEGSGEPSRARSCRVELALALNQLGRFDDALGQIATVLAEPTLTDEERPWTSLIEGFTLCSAGRLDAAQVRFETVSDLSRVLDNPRLAAAAAWGLAMVWGRRNELAQTERYVAAAQNTALGDADDVFGVPFLCDVATALGGLGQLEASASYLERARQRAELFGDLVGTVEFVLAARNGTVGDVDAQLERTVPAEWWRVLLVTADALARGGDVEAARAMWGRSQREAAALGLPEPAHNGERWTAIRLTDTLARADGASEIGRVGTGPGPLAGGAAAGDRDRTSDAPPAARIRALTATMTVQRDDDATVVPPGNPSRLLGLIAAGRGAVTIDQINEAIWPNDPVDAARTRLRNVLMRLRRAVGEVVVRTPSGLRLAPDTACDLIEFRQLLVDANAVSRRQPELAGELAERAIGLVHAIPFAEFEFEDWAASARRDVERRLIGALDLRSIQAEDDGDLAVAQAYAERALQFDRYADSRYVRIAELMVLQGRNAAAKAVLEAAALAAKQSSADAG